MTDLCDECKRVLDPAPMLGEKTRAILAALGLGPQTLGALAAGAYGRDTAINRRKVSALLKKNLCAHVESVDGKGTWRLVGVSPLRTVLQTSAAAWPSWTWPPELEARA